MKRFVIFVLTLATALILVGCVENEPPEPSPLDLAYDQLNLSETTDMTLPTEWNGVTITWSANRSGILDGTTILLQSDEISVTLTAVLSYEGKTRTKLFDLVLPADDSVVTPEDIVDAAYDALTIEVALAETTLPIEIEGATISWSADVDGILVDNTIVANMLDTEVILTATISYETTTIDKHFYITVKGDDALVLAALDAATVTLQELLEDGTRDGITSDLDLPTTYGDISISYLSDDPTYLTDEGQVHRPTAGNDDVTVDLTVTVELADRTDSFVVSYTILAEAEAIYTGYYLGADNLTSDALRQFLHDLIDDHTVRTYSQLWDDLAYTDEDPNNPSNVILIYSQLSMEEDSICSVTCPSTSSWNREHVWPKSHGGFDTDDIEGTDLHHIRPSLVVVNGSRGNLDFDEGGTLVSQTTDSYKDGDSFEPPDDVKGDIARMIFYMAIRYEGDISGELDLELNDLVNNSGPFVGRLSILLLWHEQDPPDAFEMTRNDRIEEIQGNRNPFVDHPEFVTLIWTTD